MSALPANPAGIDLLPPPKPRRPTFLRRPTRPGYWWYRSPLQRWAIAYVLTARQRLRGGGCCQVVGEAKDFDLDRFCGAPWQWIKAVLPTKRNPLLGLRGLMRANDLRNAKEH